MTATLRIVCAGTRLPGRKGGALGRDVRNTTPHPQLRPGSGGDTLVTVVWYVVADYPPSNKPIAARTDTSAPPAGKSLSAFPSEVTCWSSRVLAGEKAKTKKESRGEGRRRDRSLSVQRLSDCQVISFDRKNRGSFKASGDGGREDLIFR